MRDSSPLIALIGDFSSEVVAHAAIPKALSLVKAELDCSIAWTWVATRDIGTAAGGLEPFTGVWVVPGSPYENTDGALAAIRWAREEKIPLLGSCGGFQHMLLEFARNVAGLSQAEHAETNPNAATPVVSRLACPLVEQSQTLRLTQGSLIFDAYGAGTTTEQYHCNYGVNPEYREALERVGLRFSVEDEWREPRGAELSTNVHPFFVGTLFQSERRALRGEIPPLARAFVNAVLIASAG